MIEVVPLAPGHCQRVAGLHLAHLRTGFRGRPGRELLRAYYGALMRSEGAAGFVAEERGQVAGYVCGVWDPDTVQATLLRTQWPSLAFWGLVQMASRPALIAGMAERLRPAGEGTTASEPGYELRPIVVAPEARGSRVGERLVEALRADAAGRGFDRIYLFTEEDNLRARGFYDKLGFEITGKEYRGEIVYLRYECTVGQTEP